jgi:hypothetical protein
MKSLQYTARPATAPAPVAAAAAATPVAPAAAVPVAAVKRSEQAVRTHTSSTTSSSDSSLSQAMVPYAPALPPIDDNTPDMSVEDIIMFSAALVYDVRKWQAQRGMLITVTSTLRTLSHWLEHWQSRQSPRAQLFHYLLIELHRYYIITL